MDINLLREAILILALAAFVGIVWWAFGPSRSARFERAAISILEDDDREAATHAGIRRDERARKG
jgi:cytochrome c oxidase cbb3-type subunit 4